MTTGWWVGLETARRSGQDLGQGLLLHRRLDHAFARRAERHGDEDELRARVLGHVLKRLELTDLDRSRTRENVGRLTEESSTVDFSASNENLGLSVPAGLGSSRKGDLNVARDDNVLDQDRLDSDTPPLGARLDDLRNLGSDRLTVDEERLKVATSADVSQGRLGSLNQGAANVLDREGGAVRVDDVVDNDRFDFDRQVVLGEDVLPGNVDDLDLDRDLTDLLAERVDLDQSGIDTARELSERRNESYATLLDLLVRVGAAEAARNGTEKSSEATEAVDHGSIAPMVDIRAGDLLRVTRLHVGLAERLDVHETG